MVRRQIIKLKKTDLDRALVRGLSRDAWKTKKLRSVKEQIHLNPKLKKPKHKRRFDELDEEFK